MSDRVHSGPGTCLAEVGEEASLTGALREAWAALRRGQVREASDILFPVLGTYRWWQCPGDASRLIVVLDRADLDRLQRIHYRRRRPGARAPTSFNVYLPEGVVEFRPAEQDGSTPPTPSCAQRSYRGIQFVPRTDMPEGHALLVGAANVCITNLKREQS